MQDTQFLCHTKPKSEYNTYRFINQVPLCGAEKASEVNRCEITTTPEDGSVIYKNNFATNHEPIRKFINILNLYKKLKMAYFPTTYRYHKLKFKIANEFSDRFMYSTTDTPAN